MNNRNFNGQLGADLSYLVGQGQSSGPAAPVEFVMNGITYRADRGNVYRKQNGQLIPVTNQQELIAIENYYANTIVPPSQPYSNPAYALPLTTAQQAALGSFQSNSNSSTGSSSSLVFVGIGLLVLIVLSRQ
jgi:hypothetical protein